MTHDCTNKKNDKILKMIEKFTLKSDGTIRVKMIICSSNCSMQIKKVYFKPDADHIVKCNGKTYAKFRTCPKAENTNTKKCQSEIRYAYISALVEMNKGYVEISVKNSVKDALASCLSKAAIKEVKSTVYAKQVGKDCRKIELVGIEIPARASNCPNE